MRPGTTRPGTTRRGTTRPPRRSWTRSPVDDSRRARPAALPSAPMTSLHDLSALEQAAAIRSREVSPVELVEHYLARVEVLADAVGAFVTVTADRARAQARAAERAVADGGDLPPLHGVPTCLLYTSPSPRD